MAGINVIEIIVACILLAAVLAFIVLLIVGGLRFMLAWLWFPFTHERLMQEQTAEIRKLRQRIDEIYTPPESSD